MRDALVRAHAARRQLVDVVCACGFVGKLGKTGSCPACGANDHARMTTPRAETLERLQVNPRALGLIPVGRAWMLDHGLVAPDGPARKSGGKGGSRTPAQPHVVTPHGKAVLAAYRALVPARARLTPTAITGAEAIERRERAAIAGMTAARHADLPEVP